MCVVKSQALPAISHLPMTLSPPSALSYLNTTHFVTLSLHVLFQVPFSATSFRSHLGGRSVWKEAQGGLWGN